MIKANELRIGNWIKYQNRSDLKDHLINQPVMVDLEVLRNVSNPSNYCYDPILLTPEILEVVGFEPASEGVYYAAKDVRENGFMGLAPTPNAAGYLRMYEEGACVGNVIQHLHQLQNIYFANTGKELEINIGKLQKEAV